MKRGLPSLFILLVIFIGVAVMVVIQEPSSPAPIQPTAPPSRTAQPFDEARVFEGIFVEDILAIQFLDPHSARSITFSRNPLQLWTTPYLENITLDQAIMHQIEQTFVLMPYAHRFIPQAERLIEYGFLLDGKHYFAAFFILQDGTSHALAVGNPTEFNGRAVYYVIVDDREEIYLIYREPIDFLVQKFLKPPIVS